MKTIIVLSALVAASFAASIHEKDKPYIPIISQETDVGIDGNYHSSFETGNGIKHQEQGTVKNAGTKEAASEVQGQTEYKSPEGFPVFLEWIANEFGFQAKGNFLPTPPTDTNTPPPIPKEILRSLEYNAAHPEQNEYKEDDQ